MRLLNEGLVVKVYPPTYSDRYAKTAGDIELLLEEKVVSAYECKQRPISLDDIRHGIKKARESGVLDYCFVFTAGYAPGQEGQIVEGVLQAEGLDALLVDMNAATPDWSTTLNPIRRARFGETVVAILRDDMRRSGIANMAGELWNSLE